MFCVLRTNKIIMYDNGQYNFVLTAQGKRRQKRAKKTPQKPAVAQLPLRSEVTPSDPNPDDLDPQGGGDSQGQAGPTMEELQRLLDVKRRELQARLVGGGDKPQADVPVSENTPQHDCSQQLETDTLGTGEEEDEDESPPASVFARIQKSEHSTAKKGIILSYPYLTNLLAY